MVNNKSHYYAFLNCRITKWDGVQYNYKNNSQFIVERRQKTSKCIRANRDQWLTAKLNNMAASYPSRYNNVYIP